MSQSPLLVRPNLKGNGVLHDITPESAGWTYVSFSTRQLAKGEQVKLIGAPREVCIVLLSGKARITTKDFDSGVIGERESVFAGSPWSVYAPPGHDILIEAEGPCEVAICSSPAVGKFPPRLIAPNDVET